MDLARLRNLGVAAHIDAGKTTVTEQILHVTGVEHRVGRVDEGTATMDWMAEERERGITITAAATRVRWGEHELNVIDTPGHVDFTVEVERCMRVLDGAVLVVDAVAGVQAQTETVWRQMRARDVPAVVFVNKCDKPGADALHACATLSERLGVVPALLHYPVLDEDGLSGVVDLLELRLLTFGAEGQVLPQELPPGLEDEAGVLRAELVDLVAERDEELLGRVLEGVEPSVPELHAALRRATVGGQLLPVLCGAALRGQGIPPLLDAVVAYLPSPLDRPPVHGEDPGGGPAPAPRRPDPAGPVTALAFKLHVVPHGDLVFVRVYSGTLLPGSKLWNPRTRRMERVARLRRVHADGGVDLERAEAGDIVALTGLKATATGDTLCDREEPIVLEPVTFPEPVLSLVVEPASAEDRPKLGAALARLAHEDPSFHAREDEATGQWTVSGMGELHLEVVLGRLRGEHRLAPRVGAPRVSYREALTLAGEGSGRVERPVGSGDQEVFGAVELRVEPAPGEALPQVLWDDGVAVPLAFRPAIEEALRLELEGGPRFGFPLTSGRVRVTGGESRPGSDAEPAFAQAATQALRQALGDVQARGGVQVLEPRMRLTVEAPEEFAGGILADLGSRRADVREVRSEGDLRVVEAKAPLQTLFGYSTAVRSLSQGRASYTLVPDGFRPVPEAELEDRGLTWA